MPAFCAPSIMSSPWNVHFLLGAPEELLHGPFEIAQVRRVLHPPDHLTPYAFAFRAKVAVKVLPKLSVG